MNKHEEHLSVVVISYSLVKLTSLDWLRCYGTPYLKVKQLR